MTAPVPVTHQSMDRGSRWAAPAAWAVNDGVEQEHTRDDGPDEPPEHLLAPYAMVGGEAEVEQGHEQVKTGQADLKDGCMSIDASRNRLHC